MFSIELRSVITGMMETLLPRFSPGTKGYMVSFEVEVYERSGDDEDRKSERVRRHFLFRRANNAMNVWTAESGLFEKKSDKSEWTHRSSHDSCWRTDGVERFLNKLYFDMCKRVAPDTAPKNLENFLWGFDVQEVVVNAKWGGDGEDRYVVIDCVLAEK